MSHPPELDHYFTEDSYETFKEELIALAKGEKSMGLREICAFS